MYDDLNVFRNKIPASTNIFLKIPIKIYMDVPKYIYFTILYKLHVVFLHMYMIVLIGSLIFNVYIL